MGDQWFIGFPIQDTKGFPTSMHGLIRNDSTHTNANCLHIWLSAKGGYTMHMNANSPTTSYVRIIDKNKGCFLILGCTVKRNGLIIYFFFVIIKYILVLVHKSGEKTCVGYRMIKNFKGKYSFKVKCRFICRKFGARNSNNYDL